MVQTYAACMHTRPSSATETWIGKGASGPYADEYMDFVGDAMQQIRLPRGHPFDVILHAPTLHADSVT